MFLQIFECSTAGVTPCIGRGWRGSGRFTLKEYGYPVILQSSDNLRHLEDVGLCGSLFESIPEVVERLSWDDFRVFCFSVAFNNSYMLEFLLPDDSNAHKYPELKPFLRRWSCKDVFKNRAKPSRKVA